MNPRVVKAFLKDPEEILDYTIDWTRLLETDEIITNSEWEFETDEDPRTLVQDTANFGDKGASIWVSGGTHNVTYFVVNRITTSSNRVYERAIKVNVKNTQG
jgi:hypothetical protein